VSPASTRSRVGELRPSQVLHAFGIGAMVDLPGLSVMVMGLNDWDPTHAVEISEPRLLAAVKHHLGSQVERLLSPPIAPEAAFLPGPFDESALIGIPVASFPRWVVCPSCRLLAPLGSGLFVLKVDPYRPDRTRYVHQNCPIGPRPPTANPARFLVACAKGHLDDFPWVAFVHRGAACQALLRFHELGVSGEAADVQVRCDVCQAQRRLVEAFGEDGRRSLPACRGRRPHLRDYEEGCDERVRAILLGASNSWFPIVLSVLSVPSKSGKLEQLVEAHWAVLSQATGRDIVAAFRAIGQLRAFAPYTDDQVWQALEAHRTPPSGEASGEVDLKRPEWEVLSRSDPARNTDDFRLTTVSPPPGYAEYSSQVVLVERLREVRALIGFTRIESPGDFGEEAYVTPERRGPLSRTPPHWLPASEVRGEGIFIQFREETVRRWLAERGRQAHEADFLEAHRGWRRVRRLDPVDAGFPELRYVLLHALAHVLMRELALECGYTLQRVYLRWENRSATHGDHDGDCPNRDLAADFANEAKAALDNTGLRDTPVGRVGIRPRRS
jgi:hypothetical protein